MRRLETNAVPDLPIVDVGRRQRDVLVREEEDVTVFPSRITVIHRHRLDACIRGDPPLHIDRDHSRNDIERKLKGQAKLAVISVHQRVAPCLDLRTPGIC